MQIDGARANGATSGCRDTSPTETRDERAEHQKRGPHGFHQVIGRLKLGNAIRLEFQLGGAVKPTAVLDPFAYPGKKLQRRPDISEMRNLVVNTGFGRQQG